MYKNRVISAAALLLALLAPTAFGAVKTETVEYKDGNTVCKGYLAYDDAVTGKRPAVILVHEWWGLGSMQKKNAERLAAMGYVGFALDMYGDGALTDKVDEAGKLSSAMKSNPTKSEARFDAALDTVRKRAEVDPTKIAALGYCFGGTIVLDMARLGEDLKGVVSFHGSLATAVPDNHAKPKGRVLVCHGADDPFESKEEITAFKSEMADRKADMKFVAYPGAVHGFTNPEADSHHLDGLKYNKEAAEKSWAEMTAFLKEIFAK